VARDPPAAPDLARDAGARARSDDHARTAQRLEELGTLARSFNEMADRLERSFGEMGIEIDLRKQAEMQFRLCSSPRPTRW
jgi:nitrate/nitrite-specific signal transduction histidine kinase